MGKDEEGGEGERVFELTREFMADVAWWRWYFQGGRRKRRGEFRRFYRICQAQNL